MKLIEENLFISSGEFSNSEEFAKILKEVRLAIDSVVWGEKNKFVINPVKKGNGVVPIKNNFVKTLEEYGWQAEKRMSFANGMNPGPVDVVKETSFGDFAIEWETGNISSSHRALNKIGVGIIQNAIVGGILILPVKKLAQYLTDRIGNYEEIQPYFPLYKNIQIESGVIGVFSVEYDETSDGSPFIPKGKDGNAKK
jgi:hypothetical protein